MAPCMNKRVWCNLPDVLLERMLPLLPVSSLLRFRCVCKSWNSYILSPQFLQQCTDVNGCGDGDSARSIDSAQKNSDKDISFLLLSTWNHEFPLLVFNPSQETWHRPSLDFLREEETNFSVVSASRGLLCLSDGEGSFLVCNPMTKSKRKITMFSSESNEKTLWNIVSTSIRTFKEEGRSKFELVCVGNANGCKQATCVYDSLKNQWNVCRRNSDILFFESNGVFHGSDLMIITSFPFKLMVFNTVSLRWREHEVSFPVNLLFPCLVDAAGSIILLAAVSDEEERKKNKGVRTWINEEEEEREEDENEREERNDSSEKSLESDPERKVVAFKMWKLDDTAKAWIEIASVPVDMFSKILKSGCFEGFSCVAVKDMFYLNSSEGCIVYDASSQAWRWLPKSQVLSELHACIRDVYAIEPTLDSFLVCNSK